MSTAPAAPASVEHPAVDHPAADHPAAIVYRPLDPALGSAEDLAALRALRAERRATTAVAPPAPRAATPPRRPDVAPRPARGRHRAARGLLGRPHPA